MALNLGAELAIKDGYDWLLLMDQDRRFKESNSIERMLKACLFYNKIAVIAPITSENLNNYFPYKNEFSIISSAITSGSLLNLKAFQEIGRFREDYFIDYVDYEFCLRARSLGYLIIQANFIILEHKVGDSQKHWFMTTSHHSPLRRYYITRNRLRTMYLYKGFDPIFYRSEMYAIFSETVKIILFEKQKLKKLYMIYKGYKDFKSMLKKGINL